MLKSLLIALPFGMASFEGFEIQIDLDRNQIKKLNTRLIKLKFKPFNYLNPYLDPPLETSAELVADFYFFTVAIDHRTSSPSGIAFEGTLDGKFFHGADLLYALAIQKIKEDRDFFTAERMAQISTEALTDWLSLLTDGKRIVIYNPQERAELLQDLGHKLLQLGYRSSMELIKRCAGYLIRTEGTGLLQLVSNFKAYSDPVSKKSFLWIKFLTGRGLLQVQDLENLAVPVDNHLTRIALRTGIIKVKDEEILNRLRLEQAFTLSEDLRVREAARSAFEEILTYKKLKFNELDDFFWVLGRTHCIHSKTPLCQNYKHNPACQLMIELKLSCQHQCPLASICRGFKEDSFRALLEPNIRTFFY